jgi:hypothetical protein
VSSPDSRYRDLPVTETVDRTGRVRAHVALRIAPRPAAVASCRVLPGDRLDLLGARAYGDPELWWHVADANADRVDGLPSRLLTPGRALDLALPVRPEVLPG